MATGASFGGAEWAEVPELKRNWIWFLVLGICLIVLGVIALGCSVLATLASVVVFGWLLIVGGVLQAIHAFRRREWSGLFVDLFAGILYLIAGFTLIANPVAGAAVLTLLIAGFLIIEGISRIVIPLATPLHNRGWVLLNGIIDVVLGILIFAQWPLSGLWVIGLFVGIDMLMNGWALVMLGLMARRMPAAAC